MNSCDCFQIKKIFMDKGPTVILSRSEVASLLSLEACINGVEQAFKLYAEGKASPPGILGIHAVHGGFHIKAGLLNLGANYFVAKTNANFPRNRQKHNLPTIQGVVVVADADNGRLLALMDSIELTIIRTGAATAVATKYLSRPDSSVVTICGCGEQGRISLKMLMKVRPLKKVFAYDIDQNQANRLADELGSQLQIPIEVTKDLGLAVRSSDICVTCTSSKQYFLKEEYVSPGTFIAAVGADNEDKQEIDPALLASCKLVTDLTNQSATIGELRHAMDQGMLTRENVYAELGEIVAGKKPGRSAADEIILFDSTGMALQDVAAAAIVYEKALEKRRGLKYDFSDTSG